MNQNAGSTGGINQILAKYTKDFEEI